MSDEITFTINVRDPDAMVAWAQDNITPGTILGVTCLEANVSDDGEPAYYEATLVMDDPIQATLLKTFWAKQ